MTPADDSNEVSRASTVLYRINVLVEASSLRDVEALSEQFESVICDADHDDPSVRCPRRWFIVIEDLNADEAAEWQELLND